MSEQVTVAIPVYNGMPHVKAALYSVLNQTYKQLDIVVIDNASDDGTDAFVKDIDDPRLTLLRNPTNIGLEGNWNKALEQSRRSPFFKLFCADDLLFPNAIATEVAALQAYPSAVMTACRRRIIDDEGRTVIGSRGLPRMRGLIEGHDAIRRSVMWGTNVIGEPSAVLLRSGALKDIGSFDGTYQYLIDFNMWARVLKRGALYAIPDSLAAFRVGASSNSGTIAKQQLDHQVKELRRLADDPDSGVDTRLMVLGIAASVGVTATRRTFYRLLNIRAGAMEKRQ